VLGRAGFRPRFGGSLTGLGGVIGGSAVMLAIRIGYMLIQDTGKLVLGRHGVPEDIGIYALAAALAALPGMFHGGTVTVLMPDIAATYRAHGCNQTLRDNYHFANALTMLVGVASYAVMLSFGGAVLTLLYKLGAPAYAVFCVLTARILLTFFTGATGAFLIMTGNQRIELVNAIAMVILTFALSILGARMYGIHGVAAAGFITTLVLNAVQIAEIRIFTGFMPLTRLHLWMLLVVLGITAVHFFYFYHAGLAVRMIATVLHISLTAVVFWVGLQADTRDQLAGWIRRQFQGKQPSVS